MQNYNPLASALEQLGQVNHFLKINPNIFAQLQAPERFIEVSIPVRMDDGTTRVFTGFRSQWNSARGAYKGGIRFHPGVNENEVKALSAWMTWKTAVLNLPLGGGKGGIIVNPRELSSGELERLSRGYIRALHRNIGPDLDVPAPDVNTNAQIMAWMLDEYETIIGAHRPGTITGKPLSIGGSKVRDYATAQGAFYVLEAAAHKLGLKKHATIAIQGFGNAGSHMAQLLQEAGYKILTVSDSKCSIHNAMGLDVEAVRRHKESSGSVADCIGTENDDPDNVITYDVDILIPAALENAITAKNADQVKAKLIIEMANGPTSPEAEKILNEKGVVIVPDILANAGGVTVSYLEQVQNAYGYYWEESEVLEKLSKMMHEAFESVWAEKEKYGTTFRLGAYALAVERVAQAMADRGKS
ncbi:Glu/Leu/Phe/Val dehydrogenase [Candidatus Falkowbacteria bacterium]|nr:Glu/Leu/Phe/Val dehydrogenase [Candidatus Falkowbacteria bacterium]